MPQIGTLRVCFVGGIHGRVGSTFTRRVFATHPTVSAVTGGETRLVEWAAELESSLDPERSYSPVLAAEALLQFQRRAEDTIGNGAEVRSILSSFDVDLRGLECRWPGRARLVVPAPLSSVERRRAIGRCVRDLMAVGRLYPDRPVALEKTPSNATYAGFIAEILPKARVVVLVRHPVDVALSHTQRDWGPSAPADAARFTRSYFRRWRTVAANMRDHSAVLLVRHEDLVDQPRGVLESMCSHLGVDADPDWLGRSAAQVVESRSLRGSIDTKELAGVVSILGDEIHAFGYEM